MSLFVKSPGSVVKMQNIDVMVLAVLIRGSLIQYEVSWMIGGDRKTAWVEDYELGNESNIIEVGFK